MKYLLYQLQHCLCPFQEKSCFNSKICLVQVHQHLLAQKPKRGQRRLLDSVHQPMGCLSEPDH